MTVALHQAVTVPEGDGVTVKRLMPVHGLRNFDPFVLWDHFDISSGGFPDHPHRGFEAITYLFDGGMNHADNLGNRGTVHAGGAQRFTAGRGIVHSEFPDSRLQRNIAIKFRGLIYVAQGKVSINDLPVSSGQAACIEDETSLQIESCEGAQLMWCFGLPHHEPIYQHGPYVD